MPQLAVNIKVSTQKKHCCNMKENRFKIRHAPYLDRYASL